MSNQTSEKSEREIVIYAKIGDASGLEQAQRAERHIELHASFTNGTRSRIRKTVKGDSSSIVYTVKVPTDNDEGFHSVNEYSLDADNDFFEGFKNVSDKLIDKLRYVFPSESVKLIVGEGEERQIIEVPNVEYEVDIFKMQNGEVCEWCKIDVEVDVILDFLTVHYPDIGDTKLNIKITHLPFKPKEAILDVNASDNDRAFIDGLWSDVYTHSPTSEIV